MNADIDFDLTRAQWETLKALRTPAPEHRALDGAALQDLIGFELAVITEKVRSSRQKDVRSSCGARQGCGTWRRERSAQSLSAFAWIKAGWFEESFEKKSGY